MAQISKLEQIVQFCDRKGFIFQSSKIYGGFGATYDFGQLGLLLKKNIEKTWRFWNITQRTDMEEIEGAIFMHPRVWEASGHVGGFSDLLVEDKVSHKRYRADHLIEDKGILDNAGSLTLAQIDKIIKDHNLLSPEGNPLTSAKKFNLLVKTHLGSTEDQASLVYLKGESCQNIYLNWKRVQETSRRKLPFGIAQIGKAFRNEITVKQFIFRTREFEQMDIQYFYSPTDPKGGQYYYDFWKNHRLEYYQKYLGISPSRLRWRQHSKDEKVFYAKDAWDIEYDFESLGFKEIEGLHDRGSYDLDQHSKFSTSDLTYFDASSNQRYNPCIIESSAGLNRIFLACMFEFFSEEQISDKETRTVLKFPYRLAPYKLAILPLMKKDGLKEKAQEIFAKLRRQGLSCTFDDTGSVGKRYRRQDENGTPYCLTIDYETLKEGTLTIRNRDTMTQDRIKLDQIQKFIEPDGFPDGFNDS
jgi:glycyl-tRNA synthetase